MPRTVLLYHFGSVKFNSFPQYDNEVELDAKEKCENPVKTFLYYTYVFRSNLPQKMLESMGIGDGDGVYGWNVPPEDEAGAPPPYIPKAAFERGAQKSLKQSQVSTHTQGRLRERDPEISQTVIG